jgi:hypothetical protein
MATLVNNAMETTVAMETMVKCNGICGQKSLKSGKMGNNSKKRITK